MTFLAFASIIFAIIVSISSVILAFNSPSVPSIPSETPVQTVQTRSIDFQTHTPAYSTVTMDLHNVRRVDRIQRRFNVIAMLASRECVADSIEWATARDAITGKYSVNPLCLSRRARFGYENVFEGAACNVRCKELLASYDVDSAIANW